MLQMCLDLKVELMNSMEISLFIFLSLSIDLWVISDDDKVHCRNLFNRLIFTTHSSSRSNFPNSWARSIVDHLTAFRFRFRLRVKSSLVSLFPHAFVVFIFFLS